jgi:hypothetical protein
MKSQHMFPSLTIVNYKGLQVEAGGELMAAAIAPMIADAV